MNNCNTYKKFNCNFYNFKEFLINLTKSVIYYKFKYSPDLNKYNILLNTIPDNEDDIYKMKFENISYKKKFIFYSTMRDLCKKYDFIDSFLDKKEIINKINYFDDIINLLDFLIDFTPFAVVNKNKQEYIECVINSFDRSFIKKFIKSNNIIVKKYLKDEILDDEIYRFNVLLNIMYYYYINGIPTCFNRIIRKFSPFDNENDKKEYYFYMFFNKDGITKIRKSNNSIDSLNEFTRNIGTKKLVLKPNKSFNEIKNIKNFSMGDDYYFENKYNFNPYKVLGINPINEYLNFKSENLFIQRETDNFNIKTFDFVKLEIPFLSKNEKNFKLIKDNYKYIISKSMNFIRNENKFQKFNIPINILKVSNMIYRNDGVIEIIFELKDELLNINNENNKESEKN